MAAQANKLAASDPRIREAATTLQVYGQLPFVPEYAEGCDIVTSDGRRILAIESSGTRAPWQVDLRPACVLVVGAEDDGIPEPILARAAEVIRIPMAGFIPSYNLQAAMAVVMAERLRQLAAD